MAAVYIMPKGQIQRLNGVFIDGAVKRRFLSRMDRPDAWGTDDVCCVWIGAFRNAQRTMGTFWIKGRLYGANRLSYYIYHGSIDDSMAMVNMCEGKGVCVNPRHLRQASTQRLKLNATKAAAIRALHAGGASISAIAKQYEVKYDVIRRVVLGYTWVTPVSTKKEDEVVANVMV